MIIVQKSKKRSVISKNMNNNMLKMENVNGFSIKLKTFKAKMKDFLYKSTTIYSNKRKTIIK